MYHCHTPPLSLCVFVFVCVCVRVCVCARAPVVVVYNSNAIVISTTFYSDLLFTQTSCFLTTCYTCRPLHRLPVLPTTCYTRTPLV